MGTSDLRQRRGAQFVTDLEHVDQARGPEDQEQDDPNDLIPVRRVPGTRRHQCSRNDRVDGDSGKNDEDNEHKPRHTETPFEGLLVYDARISSTRRDWLQAVPVVVGDNAGRFQNRQRVAPPGSTVQPQSLKPRSGQRGRHTCPTYANEAVGANGRSKRSTSFVFLANGCGLRPTSWAVRDPSQVIVGD